MFFVVFLHIHLCLYTLEEATTEMNSLIKVSATKQSTDIVTIRRETTWFKTEQKKEEEDEIMFRDIVWSDFTSNGHIDFRVYEKALFEMLCDYLKLGKKPPAFTGWLPLEFGQYAKRHETVWTWAEGKTISCYHRWFSYTKEGRINFRISDRNLFESLLLYVLKFKP